MFTTASGDPSGPHAQPRRADWDGMSVATQYPLAGPQETTVERVAVPCAARPSTGFVHLDGSCHCFAGGPAPEFAPLRPDQRAS